MLRVITTTTKDIPIIQELSKIVWPITFASILSQDQIAYMMEMMYSTEALIKQMEEDDHHYILIKDEDEKFLGYLSFQHFAETSYTKIHKIYILPDQQGKGVGKTLINYVISEALKQNSKALKLNVNRYNKALGFYERIGFSIAQTEDINIGNGFLMEDYVMSMPL